jgi:hypothetical protein
LNFSIAFPSIGDFDALETLQFPSDHKNRLEVTHFLTASGQANSESQNSDEEGVFISDIARKLSQAETSDTLNLNPSQLRAFSFRLFSPQLVPATRSSSSSNNESIANAIRAPVPQLNNALPPSKSSSSSSSSKLFPKRKSNSNLKNPQDQNQILPSEKQSQSQSHGYIFLLAISSLAILTFYLRKRNSESGGFRQLRKLK